MATSAHRMPAAPIGPKPLVLFRSATSRHSRPGDHGGRGRDDGRRRAAQRVDHRDPDVLVVVQGLPVSGDEQQRVVRSDAEHQDRQQRRVLVVDHDAEALDEQVDGPHRGQRGRTDGHQRDDPQHRAAIGKDQQERNARRWW